MILQRPLFVGVSGFAAFAPSEQIKELPTSSRRQATVHRTVAFECSNPSAHPNKKAHPMGGLSYLVGVSGFEPEASWTRTKRDTKLRHTPKSKLL